MPKVTSPLASHWLYFRIRYLPVSLCISTAGFVIWLWAANLPKSIASGQSLAATGATNQIAGHELFGSNAMTVYGPLAGVDSVSEKAANHD